MNKIYFLHAVASQLQSIKSILLYVLPASSNEARDLINKYDGIAEEIAEAIVEINNKDGDLN